MKKLPPDRPDESSDWTDLSLKAEIDQEYVIQASSINIDPLLHLSRPGPLAVMITLGSCLMLAYAYYTHQKGLMMATYCLVVASLVWCFYKLQRCRNTVSEYYMLLSKAYDQIELLHRYLSQYLSELDRRTSRYFHCITNTKVTTYFKLRQIESGLTRLLDELTPCVIKSGRPKRIIAGFEAIQRPFTFYDGLEFNRGTPAEVALPDLTLTISQFIRSLESGIQELESEISFVRSTMLTPEK